MILSLTALSDAVQFELSPCIDEELLATLSHCLKDSRLFLHPTQFKLTQRSISLLYSHIDFFVLRASGVREEEAFWLIGISNLWEFKSITLIFVGLVGQGMKCT